MTRFILGVAVALFMALPSTALAYCSGGDTCPTTGGSLTVFEICADSDFDNTCSSGAVNLGGDDTVVMLTQDATGVLAVCVKISSIWRLRRIKEVGSGTNISWTSMQEDMATCLGASNDIGTVALDGSATCDGTNIGVWNYGAGYRLGIWGQAGIDTVTGGSGADQICGGGGVDTLNGQDGTDDVDGYSGNDTCDGGPGNSDQVWGYNDVDNVLDTAGSSDSLFGENGNDSCVYDNGASFSTVNCHVSGAGSDPTYVSDVTGNTSGTVFCDSVNASCWVW